MLTPKLKRREDFLNRLPSNVPFWNYENSTVFKVTDFINGNHLNSAGAKQFTRILNQDIIKAQFLSTIR